MEYQKKENNLKLVDELVRTNTKFVRDISPFLADTILDNWNSTIKAKSELKYSRTLNNLKNNLKKLEDKSKVNYEDVIKCDIAIIKKYDLDKKYRIFIKRKIRSLNNINDLFLFLFFEYDKYRDKIETKKETVVRHNIKYAKDISGYVYANMFYSGSLLVFDKLSFSNEKWLFYDAIKRGIKLDLVIPDEFGTNLSPLEKKRRIYLYAMNDLYRDISSVLSMDFDIYYPIDDYFKYASLFVSYLYKETFEYGRKNPNLNILWQESIKGYGANKGLNYYEKIYWNLMNSIHSIDKHILAGYKVVSNDQKKKSEYVLFKDIAGLVPSLGEIYRAFNEMVITNIDNNYKYYMVDLEDRIAGSLKYMEVNDMVLFYNLFKDVMKRNNANSNLYLELQKILAKEIRSRNKKEIELIIKEYLNEDVL